MPENAVTLPDANKTPNEKATLTQEGLKIICDTDAGKRPIHYLKLITEVERIFSGPPSPAERSLHPFLVLGHKKVFVEDFCDENGDAVYVPEPKVCECKDGNISLDILPHENKRRLGVSYLQKLIERRISGDTSKILIWPARTNLWIKLH